MNMKDVLIVLIVIILIICVFGVLRNKVKFEKFDGGGHKKIKEGKDITKDFIRDYGEISNSLRDFIENCGDPDEINMGDDVGNMYTVLYFAVLYNCKKLTKLLLKHGAKPYYHKHLDDNLEPFCLAVNIENPIMISLLIKHIPKNHYEILDYKNPKYKNTALHIAVNKKQYKLVEKLLKRKVLMLENGEGLTPIDIAINNRDEQMIDLFRKYNHEVILYDELHTAINKHDFDKVKDLIEKGMSVNKKDDSGISPLHCAIQAYENCRYGNDYKPSVDIIELLVKKGANVNEKDDNGMSPLYHAIQIYENISRSGGDNINDTDELRFKMIKLLIENDADVNEVRNGETLLFKVLKDQVSVWLDSGSDNEYRPPVESPLYRNEQIRIIPSDKFLDEAYKKLQDHRGEFNINYDDIIDLLIERKAKLFVGNRPNKQELKLLRIYKKYCNYFYYNNFVSYHQHDEYVNTDKIRYIEHELDETIDL